MVCTVQIMTDTKVKYVWVDEDGNQVSPIHSKFSTAMHFVAAWWSRHDRVVDRWTSLENAPDTLTQSLTKTGKPPVDLKRLVIREEAAELSESERSITDALINEELRRD